MASRKAPIAKRADLPPLAVTYTRASSREQATEGQTIEQQAEACMRYLQPLGAVLAGTYNDLQTGRDNHRHQYQEMLTHLRSLPRDRRIILVIWRVNRLGRNALEMLRCRDELQQLGVTIHSVCDGGETSNLLWNVLASIAEVESDTIGSNVTAAFARVRSNGWWRPGRVPWGYRSRPATPEEHARQAPNLVLEANPVTVPYVRELFRMVAAGATFRAAARWVAGLPPEYNDGHTWHHPTVRRALQAPVYIAQQPDGAPANWQPLIDPATWQIVQDRLANAQVLPHQASQKYLLTGMLRCGRDNCGLRMSGNANRSPRRQARYVCHGSRGGSCNFGTVAATVDQLADALIVPLAQQAEAIFKAELARPQLAPTDTRSAQLAVHEQIRDHCRTEIAEMLSLLARKVVTPEHYQLAVGVAQRKLDEALRAIATLHATPDSRLPALDVLIAQARTWPAVLRALDLQTKRDLFSRLVETLTLTPDRAHLVPHWTPLGLYLAQLAGSEPPTISPPG